MVITLIEMVTIKFRCGGKIILDSWSHAFFSISESTITITEGDIALT